jgi:poly(hydroxyalkanoate) depolymerase family esterase
LISLLFLSLPTLAISQPSGDFQVLNNFGNNPGELTASYLSPSKHSKSLVVLLHGCVQQGQVLAKQSGFVALAKQHDFSLLLPQQSSKNNVKSCFNWFSEQDTAKDQGEVLSIKNMIVSLKAKSEFEQVYIAGLSAGGAMTSALLTHYPELFSAGAVIAGLPYPCANDLAKAISCMRNGPSQTVEELVSLAKQGNEAVTSWPKLIVITGNNDKIVNPKNSSRLALQWAKLSKKSQLSKNTSSSDFQITLWQNSEEQPQVKLVDIKGIGHGLTVNSALKNRDVDAPFLYESSFDTALNIVEFWLENSKTQ